MAGEAEEFNGRRVWKEINPGRYHVDQKLLLPFLDMISAV